MSKQVRKYNIYFKENYILCLYGSIGYRVLLFLSLTAHGYRMYWSYEKKQQPWVLLSACDLDQL